MVTLMNVNKVAHNQDWTIVDQIESNYIVAPSDPAIHWDQGICVPTALGIVTNTLCDTVIQDLRRYDPDCVSLRKPGAPIHVLEQVVWTLFHTKLTQWNESFNSFQHNNTEGTYIVWVRLPNERSHVTVLQDGVEYGAGSALHCEVQGYWKLD